MGIDNNESMVGFSEETGTGGKTSSGWLASELLLGRVFRRVGASEDGVTKDGPKAQELTSLRQTYPKMIPQIPIIEAIIPGSSYGYRRNHSRSKKVNLSAGFDNDPPMSGL